MCRLFLAFIFASATMHLQDQTDTTLLKVLERTLYDGRVYPKVFFDYEGIGKPPFVLPKGKYAFIYPDSVFCLAYPEIAYDLSMTWANERKIQTMTYIKNDSGTVFVKANGDNNMRFHVLFDEIRISPKEAKVRFKTSCECRDNEIGTMYFFDVDLVLASYIHNDSTTVFVTYYMDKNIPFNIIFDKMRPALILLLNII